MQRQFETDHNRIAKHQIKKKLKIQTSQQDIFLKLQHVRKYTPDPLRMFVAQSHNQSGQIRVIKRHPDNINRHTARC